MKPQFEDIHIKESESSFEVFKIEVPAFEPFWHYHPELELTYIQNGNGIRFIGDHISPFHSGDLILTGENLPHHWVSDSKSDKELKKAFVIQFPKSLLNNFPECTTLRKLFDEARYGLFFPSADKALLKKIRELEGLVPLKRLIGLLEIFNELSGIEHNRLSTVSFNTTSQFDEHQSRINKVTTYILTHFNQNITLKDISELCQMTSPAFCRWFKKSVGKSFVTYITWVRVEKACQYLVQTDLTIAQIAFESGFESISNFNRAFKKIKAESPREYKKKTYSRYRL